MRTWKRVDWLSWAWLTWGALALGFAVMAFFYPHSHTVYPIYAPAARRWWVGLDIYVLLVDYYRYSPLFAILITPFAVLQDCWGGSLWKAFNIAVYAFGLASACRYLLPAQLTRNQRAALWVLALPLSFHSMYNGQANLIMLGTLLLGLSAAARGHWNRAALWVALATLIKGYPGALGLLLSALYFRKFALRYVVFLAAGLLLPFATQPPGVVVEQYTSWGRHLSDSTTLMRERLRSIDYLLYCYRNPISPRTFNMLGVLGGVCTLGVCLLWARRVTEPRALLTRVYLLFATWVALLGPATETCGYIILAPAIAWAVVEAFTGAASIPRRMLLLASLFLMGPSVTDLVGSTLRDVANAYGAQPIGAILFLAHLLTLRTGPAAAAVQEPRSTASPVRQAA
jgi:hypothetical protein